MSFTCQRCKNIMALESDFPDTFLTPTRLQIGSGDTVEYFRTTPLLAAVLDRLITSRGQTQTWNSLISAAYSDEA